MSFEHGGSKYDHFAPILLQKSARKRRGTVGAILKPSIAARWIVRATYARLY
jgi:hypothetical protein